MRNTGLPKHRDAGGISAVWQILLYRFLFSLPNFLSYKEKVNANETVVLFLTAKCERSCER
jgi:hypothetical protein